MKHRCSAADRDFREAFENFGVTPDEFDHRAHVRLAYVYLCESGSAAAAVQRMKKSLLAFLDHLGVDHGKFHETLTGAWIDAVNHFMAKSQGCSSFKEFIELNPLLLDSKIMLSHYSADLLFSNQARASYVDPDLEPIPKH